MANSLATIGWLVGRLVGVALLPAGLVVFVVLGLFMLFGGPSNSYPYLAKPYGAFMMVVGCYWLWLGTRLIRGLLAVTADLRRFLTGNLCLLAACVVFLIGVAVGQHDRVPADATAMPFATGALWLWTAVRLLKVDGAPAAGLGRFAASNVLIVASLACAFLSVVGIHAVGGQPWPGAIVLAAGLALLAIAAWLLRAAAPRQRLAEETQHPDTRWSWRHVGGFAIILLGFVVLLKAFVLGSYSVLLILRGILAEDASVNLIAAAVTAAREMLFAVFGGICFSIGLRFYRGKQEKLSDGNLVFICVTAVLYAYAVFAP
ncbi:MAG: hypothetical protein ISN26_07025 [Betaproteobacteria bacterium AqS2]|uniref:Uncharacterized protein n=1 Tax=Candidatus Amphirhobacter heronislandensis TaxID=1732024 RepID=A0A930XYE7_9GAMM|nr:hypothetical protein [Betaproteobacteria bacterium AqS2]